LREATTQLSSGATRSPQNLVDYFAGKQTT